MGRGPSRGRASFSPDMYKIRSLDSVPSVAEVDAVRGLFRQYAGSLGFDLGFEGIEQELAALPGDYAPPRGRLLLALVGRGAAGEGAAAGCAALRPLGEPEEQTCEMKRLYVMPAVRGVGLGRRLAVQLVAEGREAGYRRMRLDSIDFMKEALGLYRALGFREIPPYRYNPIPGAIYPELELEER